MSDSKQSTAEKALDRKIQAIKARLDTGFEYKTKCQEDCEWSINMCESLTKKLEVAVEALKEIPVLDRCECFEDARCGQCVREEALSQINSSNS